MVMEDINRRYVEMAKKYGFNPVLLREIIRLRNRGYNNSEIALQLGISRNTVTNYLEKLKKTDDEEFLELLILIAAILGGAMLIAKLFEK